MREISSVSKGPEGQGHPGDVIGGAVKVARTATGKEDADLGSAEDRKDPAAKALGKKGGLARARSLTPEQRQEIARKGAAKRWGRPG